MTRITLVILFGLSIFASFPAQAGNRDWHKHTNHSGHHYQHNGDHYQLHRGRHHGRKNRSHKHYRGQVQFFTLPIVATGTRYGYSASGKVIVFQSYSLNDRR